MFKWKLYLPALYIAIVPLIFGYFGKPTEMGLAAITGCLLLVFLNLEQFQSFKGAGFEATMREVDKAVTEAYATIGKLQDIAASLAEPIVIDILMRGKVWGGPLHLREANLSQIQAIEKSLVGIGVPIEKVDSVIGIFYRAIENEYIYHIITAIQADENAPEAIKSYIEIPQNSRSENFDIFPLIEESNWQYSNRITELLEDFKFFKEHHKYKNRI